jgi:hypothetical protein
MTCNPWIGQETPVSTAGFWERAGWFTSGLGTEGGFYISYENRHDASVPKVYIMKMVDPSCTGNYPENFENFR